MLVGVPYGGGLTSFFMRKCHSFLVCLPLKEGGDTYAHDLGAFLPILRIDGCYRRSCRQYLSQQKKITAQRLQSKAVIF